MCCWHIFINAYLSHCHMKKIVAQIIYTSHNFIYKLTSSEYSSWRSPNTCLPCRLLLYAAIVNSLLAPVINFDHASNVLSLGWPSVKEVGKLSAIRNLKNSCSMTEHSHVSLSQEPFNEESTKSREVWPEADNPRLSLSMTRGESQRQTGKWHSRWIHSAQTQRWSGLVLLMLIHYSKTNCKIQRGK